MIDTIPVDALKNWIELRCEADSDMIAVFKREERQTMVREKLCTAWKWGRLYGGAGAVMMIRGQEDMLDEPVDFDMIMPGDFKGLLVLDRWSGISPSAENISDINSPDFGLPLYYRVTTQDGTFYNVHASRVLRFIGRDLPLWEKLAEVQWGISEVEVIYEELTKRDNTSWNIASLVFLANIRVLKMGDLGQILASGNAAATRRVYNVLSAQNQLMSNMSLQVIGKDDEFDNKSYSFGGLNEIYQSFMLDLSGATGIPMTRLFGRSPAGMNATGEGDENIYESLIAEKQDSEVRPQLEKLLPVMCMSAWGEIPADLTFEFLPFRTLDGKERAELSKAKVEALVSVYNAGGISQRALMQELALLGPETGMFTQITEGDIAAAEDKIQSMDDWPPKEEELEDRATNTENVE